MTDDKPTLHVVSSISDAEARQRREKEDAEQTCYAFKELAANLLRIIRGAGKSYLLPQQLKDCQEALDRHLNNQQDWPLHHIEYALRARGDHPPTSNESGFIWQQRTTTRAIVANALQLTASELLGQPRFAEPARLQIILLAEELGKLRARRYRELNQGSPPQAEIDREIADFRAKHGYADNEDA